jgi:hypothetical protein
MAILYELEVIRTCMYCNIRTIHDLDAGKTGTEVVNLHVLPLPSEAVE